MDSAARIFRDVDVAVAATRQASAGQTGELRVGFGPTLCRAAGFSPAVVQESREVYTTVGLVGAGVTIVPATVQRRSWNGVVYKPIARASVQLSMVRASGAARQV